MRTRSKLIFAGLAAAMLMAMAVGNASANRLSISHGNLFRIEWSSLELATVGIAGVRCAVTLEGSFHSVTIPKVAGLLIGYITHASIKNNPCILGSATILSETLPWHIRYRGFRGELPNITGGVVALVGASFRLANFATTGCLSRTTTENPSEGVIEEAAAEGTAGNRIFRKVVPNGSAVINCTGVEGGASINGVFRSAGNLREVPGGSVNLLVRLI